jgi:hypothetical protein
MKAIAHDCLPAIFDCTAEAALSATHRIGAQTGPCNSDEA